jgi:hypothetical protein
VRDAATSSDLEQSAQLLRRRVDEEVSGYGAPAQREMLRLALKLSQATVTQLVRGRIDEHKSGDRALAQRRCCTSAELGRSARLLRRRVDELVSGYGASA